MSGIISGLAGAGGAANTAGGYYTNAANQIASEYGSPAAQMFSKEYISSLQPGFEDQQRGLLGTLSALGITNSGAGKADLSNLYGQEAAGEAAGIAPMYQQALGQYGNIISQEPGAQNNAYQNAIQNFYAGISDAASLAAGLPPTGQTSGGVDYSGSGLGPSNPLGSGGTGMGAPGEYDPYAVGNYGSP